MKNKIIVSSVLATTLLVTAAPFSIEAASHTNDPFGHLLSHGNTCVWDVAVNNYSSTSSVNIKNVKSQYAVIPDENLLKALNDVVLGKGQVTTPILVSELANTSTTSVDLSGRNISDLTGIEHLTMVETLNLSNNSITDIGPLEQLNSLGSLDLSNNQVRELEPLRYMRMLVTLNLSYNHITDIEALGGMIFWAQECGSGGPPAPGCTDDYLQTLDLSYNYLTDTADWEQASYIKSYDLKGNFLPTQFYGQNSFNLPSSVEVQLGKEYTIPLGFTSLANPPADVEHYLHLAEVHSPNGTVTMKKVTSEGLTIVSNEVGVEEIEVTLIPGITHSIQVTATEAVAPPIPETPATTAAEYNLSIGFRPGVLSLKSDLGPIDLGTIYLDGGAFAASAEIGEFTVEDYTGLGEGWKLSVRADRMTSNSLALPANSLFIDPTGLKHNGQLGQGTVTLANQLLYIDNGSSHIIAEAAPNNGLGVHTLGFTGNALHLEVDQKDIPNGRILERSNGNTYKTTITFTLTKGI